MEHPCPPETDADYERWRRSLLVGSLYGAASDDPIVRKRTGPSRLTVRDSFATEDTINDWKAWLGENIYTEVKTENTLDRLTAEANPRPIERVPAGSYFGFNMILDAYDLDGTQLAQPGSVPPPVIRDAVVGAECVGRFRITRARADSI